MWPGFKSWPVVCGLSLMLVREVSGFPLSSKTNIFKLQCEQEYMVDEESLRLCQEMLLLNH